MNKKDFEWKKDELEEDIPIFKKSLNTLKKQMKKDEEEFNISLLKNFEVLKLKVKITKNKIAFNVEELPQDLKDKYELIQFEKQEIKRKGQLLKELTEKLQAMSIVESKEEINSQPETQAKDLDMDFSRMLEIAKTYYERPHEDFDAIIKRNVSHAKRQLRKQAKKEKQP